MDQLSFGDAHFASKGKTTRKERFLAEMEQVVPWPALLRLIAPVYPEAGNGRRPCPLVTMLRIHLLQNWFSLSNPAMEDALYDMPALRQFARLSSQASIPDESTILNFAIRAEKRKAQVRARVEHPFRTVKCVFGFVKVRFKGLAKGGDALRKLNLAAQN